MAVATKPTAKAAPAPAPPSSGMALIDEFAQGVANATGLDPLVVKTWATVEGAYAPNGTGHFNFLNVRPNGRGSFSGVALAGVSPNNFQQFQSVGDAITETSYWINNFSNYAGIRAATGKPWGVQLAAIAASPWDAGRYGGGGSLVRAYTSLVHPAPGSGGTSRYTIGDALHDGKYILTGSPDKIAASLGKNVVDPALQKVPGYSAFKDVAGGVAWLGVGHNWLRIGYVLGGSILVLGGLLLLAKSVGAPIPTPALGAAAATEGATSKLNTSGEPISQSSRRARREAGFELPADAKPARGEPGSSKLGAGDTIPF